LSAGFESVVVVSHGGKILKSDRGVGPETNGRACGHYERPHPSLTLNSVNGHEHDTGRYANRCLDHRLEYALAWLADGFVSVAVVDDAVNAHELVIIGSIVKDDAPKLEHFACGLGLDSAAGEVQGGDEWKAGLYESK
jgi:hypothetical protein